MKNKKLMARISSQVKRILRLFISRLSARRHLSGNGFAKMCDYYVHSVSESMNLQIKRASSIFVKSDYTIEFLEKYENVLEGKVVISGNGDTNFDLENPCFRHPKKLYLQNLGFEPTSENIKILPIGLENYEHLRSGFGVLHRPPRRHIFQKKILVPPMSPTNSIRRQVLDELKLAKSDLFQIETKIRSVLTYVLLTKKYKFILVCEGNGHDTHRLWEVLYQNSFPVMLESQFSRNIEKLGVPVLIVKSLLDISETVLSEHLSRNRNYDAKRIEELWLPYWKSEML